MVQERTLQRGKRIGFAETLDRLDFRTFGLCGRDHARADLSAVHHHRTGTAIAGIAADFGACEAEVLTQHGSKSFKGITRISALLAVHGKLDI